MKRVLSIQDLSCVGKCSQTVALPILSAMGVEACPLPTSYLSNHTAFPEFTFLDLSDSMRPVMETLDRQKIRFDGVCTGYLGTTEQIAIVTEICRKQRENGAAIIVDPAMGDDGILYSNLSDDYARCMRSLCAAADVILPNVTEACFLSDVPYEENHSEAFVERLLKENAKLGAKAVIITGVCRDSHTMRMEGIESSTGRRFFYETGKEEKSFPGTGDVFAACFVGALMRGFSQAEALELAADFTVKSIQCTVRDPEHRWYGVNFEEAFPALFSRIYPRF